MEQDSGSEMKELGWGRTVEQMGRGCSTGSMEQGLGARIDQLGMMQQGLGVHTGWLGMMQQGLGVHTDWLGMMPQGFRTHARVGTNCGGPKHNPTRQYVSFGKQHLQGQHIDVLLRSSSTWTSSL